MLEIGPVHGVPRVETIHGHVRRHAESNPNAAAILGFGRAPLTYAALESQLIHVGEELRRAGIGRTDRVAVVLPPAVESSIAFLAIAANVTTAPLNIDFTAREFESYFSAIRAEALIVPHGSSRRAVTAAQSLNIRILYLLPEVASPAGLFSLTEENMRPASSAPRREINDVALLLFTSGTTAQSKLVPLTHTQLCLSAESICSVLQISPADRCLGVMPLHHIHGLSTLFASLVSGGSYIGMSGFSPENFFAGLDEFRPSWYSASPAIHRAILDSASSELRATGLRFVRSASAPMPERLIVDIEDAFGVPLIEAYGMTEAAPQIASNRLPPFKRKPGSVGKAAGPDIAIMDGKGRILPTGETGEVVIRGLNVIERYDGEFGANEEAFVGGWLRTGDLGHLDSDGYLFLKGRRDDVINRGGEKIAPGLVEEVLLEHPAIAEAAVFGVPHAVLGQTIAAAIVLKPGKDLREPVKKIRDFTAERLARFGVPQKIAIVDRIPLSPTGKLSRKDLPWLLTLEEGRGRALAPLDQTGPRNATERRVAEIFAEVLKCDPLAIHADFFELGGHSLAAMKVLARLRQIFRTTLPIDALFVSPTVARLAERIGEQMANMVADGTARLESHLLSAPPASEAYIPRLRDTEPAPLSLAQQRVYFLDQIGSGAAYNMSASLWLTGKIDERALRLALNEIVRRHKILRTTFPMRGDHPVQIASPPLKAELAVLDLTGHPEAERAAEAMQIATQEARQPFDLEVGPPFRSRLVRLSDQEAVLLLTMHHIVSDGWSIGVLYRELTQLYAAFRGDHILALPELPLQYGDYAAWQQSQADAGRFEREAAYWTRQLEYLPPACTFPVDRPRPAIQSYRGAIEQVFIDRHLIDRLKSFAAGENVTLFMMLLAAFKTLLFRYNGQDDCVVGVPIASRSQTQFEPLIGLFANTLVLRNSLAGDPSFTDLLSRVRASTLDAFAHHDIPLERLMQNLRIARDLSRTPLFQVMFAFQNMPDTAGSAAGIELFARTSFDLASDLAARPFRVDNGTTKFDLTLYLAEADEGMAATWQFNTDLFDPATIHRLAWQFQTLLEGIASNPRQRLSELPLLSEADNRQAEIDWNRTETRHLSGRNFVQLFEAQVERTPNGLAVQSDAGALTYRALNERSNQLARYFQSLRIGHDRPTAVCLGRAPEMVAVLLGLWKAGGAFLPLDPEYPPGRMAFKLSDARVSLLVTETELLPKVAAAIQAVGSEAMGVPEIVCIDACNARIASESTRNLEATPAADALAYVMYTSGSTGKPKGVMITHGNVCHYAQALAQALGIHADDRYLHSASFSFSSSMRQIVVPLYCGATVAIASTDALRDPQALFEIVRRRNITVLDFVPSFSASCLQVLMSLEPSARAHMLDNHVRLMLSASEPLPSALIERWRRLCRPATTFVNMFGQTETTGIVLTYPIPVGGEAATVVPIGRPIANTQSYVLDGSRRLVPIGICGELYIGGGGVGRGYINQPHQTAKCFVSNPFARQVGKRLYRTGDLARYRSDGVVEIVGRVDEQIKIRGFRVEPGEIEAAIRTHPRVHECVVSAVDDALEQDRTGSRKSLVAFVVADAEPSGEPNAFAADLREFLKQKLPDYLLPQRIVALPRLPRTPGGKIDLQALLAGVVPHSTAARVPESSASLPEPRPNAEKLLTDIWKKVLQLDSVRPGDNFFDLGGNSKLSINVVFEARLAGLSIALSQLYQHQTIAELASIAVESKPPASLAAHVGEISGETSELGPLVTIESLRAFGREALTRAGLAQEGVEIVTEVQLEASLRGQPTHDMVSIPRYAARISFGKINARPRIRIEHETCNSALIDGDNGPGQWASTVAMDVAMRKGREQGIGIVSVRRSNHFGAAGHYVWNATRNGLIGLCTTNGPLVLAPTGGVTPTFGNNPLAVGIPAGRHPPILLDMAMSVAPRSKIGLAVAEGKSLPPGWILDRFGQPSTELADLAAGLGVPIGGHKGYGLALVLEVLAGVLSGAGFASDHRPDISDGKSGPPDYGHLFVAIDPQRFMPAPSFAARVDRLIDDTKQGERAAGVDEILIPGEAELKTRERSLQQGVRLRPSAYRALLDYGHQQQFTARLVTVSTARHREHD